MPSRKGAPKPEYDQLTPGGDGSVTSRTTTDPVSLPDALAVETATADSANRSAAFGKRLNHFIRRRFCRSVGLARRRPAQELDGERRHSIP
jgi:hypothetical protein